MKLTGSKLGLTYVVAIFLIGAVGYWIVSYALPDGLEKTMQEAGVEEQTPIYQAPLSYGDGYGSFVLMGLIGFFSILCIAFILGKLMAKKNGA